MSATVTVRCAVPGGLNLRLFEMKPEPDTGVRKAYFTGESLTLKEGRNAAVDGAFMAAWLEQNEQSDFVTGKLVAIEKAPSQ
jgi:hypothetical protein